MTVMMSSSPVPLRLQFAGGPRRPMAARFFPGDDPRAWLVEMTRCGLPLANAQLLIVPRSAEDRTPLGVVVPLSTSIDQYGTASEPDEMTRLGSKIGCSLPYGVIAGRLYVPIDAEITPPVNEVEWAGLFSEECIASVWHPVAGLIGFEQNDVLRVSDLIQPPACRNIDWSRAETGEALNQRLWTITAEDLGTADEIIKSGGDDIGSKGHQSEGLSPKIGESVTNIGRGIGAALLAPFRMLKEVFSRKGDADRQPTPEDSATSKGPGVVQSLRDAGRGIAGAGATAAGLVLLPVTALAGGIRRLLAMGRGTGGSSHAPGAGDAADGGGGWLDGLSERFRNLTTQLLSARQREINRLLKMLQDDPDEGLKYGIPFDCAGGAGRGVAPPGWLLMRHLVNFSLSGLGGGGLVDAWDIGPDQQVLLVKRYRELAERELRLKRFRRAAYIYAKLLGDLSMAANALMQGKHFGEAAVLYRDKLGRPTDAARAFEQGGMFEDALGIYESLQQFETIGDLYVRLMQPDDAADAYERAVNQALGYDDRIRAARLIKEKLNDAERALTVLEEGWPKSKQAKLCLDESFLLTAELGQHDRAAGRIERFKDLPLREQERRQLVETLCHLVGTYPDRRIEDMAADAARVMTSRALVINSRQQPLLNAIARIAPQDEVHERDCRRFGRQSHQPRPPERLPAVRSQAKQPTRPELLLEIPLPPDVNWCQGRATSFGWYLAGYNSRELVLAHGVWQRQSHPHQHQHVVSWSSRLLDDRPLLMDVEEQRSTAKVALFAVGGPPLPPRLISKSLRIGRSGTVETPGWLPDDALAMDSDGSVLTWILAAQDFRLMAVAPDGTVWANASLVEELTIDDPPRGEDISMLAREEGVYVGLGDTLVVASRSGRPKVAMRFDEEIRGLVASPRGTILRLCVLFDDGAVLFRGSVGESAQTHHLRGSLRNPLGVALRDSHLILADESSWQIYDVVNVRPKLIGDARHGLVAPVALLRTQSASHVAVLSRRGPLRVFSL